MNHLEHDLDDVLNHLRRLVEVDQVAFGIAIDRTQATYHRYSQYRLRCMTIAARTIMRFPTWLRVDAEYQAVAAAYSAGHGDLVQLAHLQRQLAFDAVERGGSDGRS